jgi:hypothetical protein
MLATAALARGAEVAAKDEAATRVDKERGTARAQRRWLAWLRLSFALWRARRAVARERVRAQFPTNSEEAMRAGGNAEDRVAVELGRALGEEWLLFRGYRNARGEIDGVLLGPGGLFAYEVKYVNATIYISGDHWIREKWDNYGNLVEGREPMTDKGQRRRSPSRQVNEPADALADWLRRRGRDVVIHRFVLLTHPKIRIGESRDATVHVETSVQGLLRLVERSRPALTAKQTAAIAEIIRRDHQHTEQRLPRGEARGRR